MQGLTDFLRTTMQRGLGVPILMLLMLAMVVLPLPPLLLDMLFTFNITLALVVLLVAVYTRRPLEFALFPAILLIATLLRLGLNVASTRVVLLEGHTGTDAAGQVIKAFGEFVVGGNYAVGIVVFVILVIINFAVVTKGAGRISEVTARFTLDAMPGKQMAIDADLNAGLIDQDEARRRRAEVAQEADFYGAMDGASKFVRGDAVAGILITIINVLGGLAIGMLQHNLGIGEATRNYTLLTIGDGLVAQIPSLLLSTAAGIIVTRMSSSHDMGEQVIEQLFANPRALGVTAGILGFIGLIPGMPNLAFLTLAVLSGAAAYFIARRAKQLEEEPPPEVEVVRAGEPEPRELGWDDVQPVDPVGLEVGYRLIPLVDKNQGGQLMARIKGVRKKLSQELGFLVPAVHIRDNLELAPNAYRITVQGVVVGEADIHPERDLAINPGKVFGVVTGLPGKDPAFGLDAVWIEHAQREQAQSMGYTVVDPSTVVATHLSQILQGQAHALFGHQEAQQLLELLAKGAPRLAEDLPKALPLASLVRVMQNLLREGVPLRDIRTVAETLAEHAPRSQDPGVLTTAVRSALGPLIIQNINGMAPELPVMTLDPALEQILQNGLQPADGGAGGGVEPGLAERLMQALAETARNQEAAGRPAILLVDGRVRATLSRLARHSVPGLHVLAYDEVPDNKNIRIVATVGGGSGARQTA